MLARVLTPEYNHPAAELLPTDGENFKDDISYPIPEPPRLLQHPGTELFMSQFNGRMPPPDALELMQGCDRRQAVDDLGAGELRYTRVQDPLYGMF